MKEITLEQVKELPNGTKVFVKCTGSDWNLDKEELNSWNVKQEDGLYYDDQEEISFPYDYDYRGDNLDIVCLVDDGTTIYTDEFGNHFNLSNIEDVSAIINDMFSTGKNKNKCDCILGNLEGIIQKAYVNRIMELTN